MLYYFCIPAGRVIINEVFERYLKNHLQSEGLELVELKEKYFDDAFGEVKYDIKEAKVDLATVEVKVRDKPFNVPYVHKNGKNEPVEETISREYKYTTGMELMSSKESGWTTTGGLSLQYQGVGGSGEICYTRNQSSSVTKTQSEELTDHIEKVISIPAKSSVKVVLTHRLFWKKCTLQDVKFTFPSKAKIKCKYKNARQKVCEKKFDVARILMVDMKPDCGTAIATYIEGKYAWIESELFLDIQQPK